MWVTRADLSFRFGGSARNSLRWRKECCDVGSRHCLSDARTSVMESLVEGEDGGVGGGVAPGDGGEVEAVG
jgi:hypothetical protein